MTGDATPSTADEKPKDDGEPRRPKGDGTEPRRRASATDARRPVDANRGENDFQHAKETTALIGNSTEAPNEKPQDDDGLRRASARNATSESLEDERGNFDERNAPETNALAGNSTSERRKGDALSDSRRAPDDDFARSPDSRRPVAAMTHPDPDWKKRAIYRPSNDTCKRRTVIYAGPPKTGSTSVQDFFMKYGSNDALMTKLPAFRNWDLPRVNWPFCKVFKTDINATREALSRKKLAALARRQREHPVNTFWACEFLSAAMLRPGRDRLVDMFQWWKHDPSCDNIEIVIHYRTPRVDHLLSAWKQLTADHHVARAGLAFRNFACASDPDGAGRIRRVLAWATHPLRHAEQFRDRKELTMEWGFENRTFPINWKVIVVDMAGVTDAGQDIVQNLACGILGVPCRDAGAAGSKNMSLVDGLEDRPAQSNVRPREEHLMRPDQRDALEALFRNRDCLYKEKLDSDPLFRVDHRDSLWRDCPSNMTGIADLDDLEVFVDKLHEIMECSAREYSQSRERMPMFKGVGLAQIGIVTAILYASMLRKLMGRSRTV